MSAVIIHENEYQAALYHALRAIADLPTPKDEKIMQGHEDAYRAVEALTREQG